MVGPLSLRPAFRYHLSGVVPLSPSPISVLVVTGSGLMLLPTIVSAKRMPAGHLSCPRLVKKCLKGGRASSTEGRGGPRNCPVNREFETLAGENVAKSGQEEEDVCSA